MSPTLDVNMTSFVTPFQKEKKKKKSWDSRLILLQLMSVIKWSFIQISIIRDNTKYTNTLMSPISVGYRLELQYNIVTKNIILHQVSHFMFLGVHVIVVCLI